MTTHRNLPSQPWYARILPAGAGLLAALFMACGGHSGQAPTSLKTSDATVPSNTLSAVATLSLFAGDPGGFGAADGVGIAARFASPVALAADPNGTIYVGDPDNRAIRKVAPDGTVTTFVGKLGFAGWTDGSLGVNRMAQPNCMVRGEDGTIYVGDSGVSGIAKISPDGYMTTLIPGGSNTYTDGVGTNVRFNGIFGMALDPAGYLYITDNRNHAIRKLNLATTEVTTVAGGTQILSGSRTGSIDGPVSTAQIGYPSGIVWTPGNILYVSSYRTNTIRKIDLKAGMVSTVAGVTTAGYLDGQGTAAKFRSPMGLALDGMGNLLVADMGNNLIRNIDLASAAVTTVAGTPMVSGHLDGIGTAASFNQPYGLTFDYQGRLLVGDYQNAILRRVDVATRTVKTLAGAAPNPGSTDGPRLSALFNDSYGMCQDAAGNVFVADTSNHVIRKIATNGTVSTLAGIKGTSGHLDGPAATATFTRPTDVAIDAGGNLFVADRGNNSVRKIAADGTVSTFAGSTTGTSGTLDGSGTAARFYLPSGLAMAATGELYVADAGNNRIRKILADGTVTTLAGSARGLANGVGAAATFNGPFGLSLDGKGKLYVADTQNNAIRVMDLTTLNVTTLAGDTGVTGTNNGLAGAVDGTGTAVRFNYPYRVAVDAAGNILVSDYGNNTIRKVTTAGVSTTVVGTLKGDGLTGSSLGIILGALPSQLDLPKGMIPQADGSVLVISNHCILSFKGY